ncbi:MAG: HIT family protein [Clostridiales bacterium]|jgi:histidine triad (HIT) family protein|nr:HIT family protein [Clostridiales bacterium]
MCLFCKVANGEIPAYKLYEDEAFVVILDRFPSALGHSLIIPKKHCDDIYSMGPGDSEKLFPLVVKIAGALKNKLKPEGLNILQNNGEAAGQSVGHFHVHLIPRFKGDSVSIKWGQQVPTESEFEGFVKGFNI